jgi:hypothetical protein
MLIRKLFYLCLFTIILSDVFSMGSKIEMVPMKVKVPDIKDMEYQKYAFYQGSELVRYFYYVTHLHEDGKTMDLGLSGYDISGPDTNMAKMFSGFRSIYTFDLIHGTLICVKENNSNYNFTHSIKGNYATDIDFDYDYETLAANCTMKSWDGYETAVQKSRIALKKGYSHFYINNTLIMSVRMFDFTKPGIIYAVGPQVIKDPIPGTYRFLKKEEVTTPAGKYESYKIGMAIADPFMSKLLESYTKEVALWVEDSPRNIMVKFKNADGSWGELVETGIWKDRI